MLSAVSSSRKEYLLGTLALLMICDQAIAASPPWSGNQGQQLSARYGMSGLSGPEGNSNTGSAVYQRDSPASTLSLQTPLVGTHGILAAVAFVLFFPMGSILMRVVPGRFAIWVHALTGLAGYTLFFCAAAIGFYLAGAFRNDSNEESLLTDDATRYHLIIGMLILITLLVQPILGHIHHRYFKRVQRRQVWSYLHLWNGRISITLGIINGGLGIQLSNPENGYKIAYAVVAAAMWLSWAIVAVMSEIRRRKPKTGEEPAGSGMELRGKSRSTGTGSSRHDSVL